MVVVGGVAGGVVHNECFSCLMTGVSSSLLPLVLVSSLEEVQGAGPGREGEVGMWLVSEEVLGVVMLDCSTLCCCCCCCTFPRLLDRSGLVPRPLLETPRVDPLRGVLLPLGSLLLLLLQLLLEVVVVEVEGVEGAEEDEEEEGLVVSRDELVLVGVCLLVATRGVEHLVEMVLPLMLS